MADETIVTIPVDGVPRTVKFIPRDQMRPARVRNAFFESFKAPSLPPVPSLPVDYTKGGTLQFPYLGNDRYGDCFMAAVCHHDQLFTGMNGSEAVFDTNAVVQAYLKLAGGDRGLTNDQIFPYWRDKGLPGVPDARIFDYVDVDPTNAPLLQSGLYLFGGVQFQLSVPSRWLNSFTAGTVWDAPAVPNPLNGHAIVFAGIDKDGRYRFLTWGSYGWMTQAGLKSCDPSAQIVASKRWFNASGYAPNGLHYTQLAPLWEQAGGHPWPASPYPAPGPSPLPNPVPTDYPTSGKFRVGPYEVAYTAVLRDPPPTP